jgi:hydrogenase maturation protease
VIASTATFSGTSSGPPLTTKPILAVRILVCGNADRGDDGAALAAVARVLPALPPAVLARIEVRRCVQLDATDLIDVADSEACLIVDTVVGVEPGEIVTIPLACLATGPGPISPRSSHALPIDQTIGLASTLRGAPVAGFFVGIGGRWFAYGQRRFSRPVKANLVGLRAAIVADLEFLLAGEGMPPCDGARTDGDGTPTNGAGTPTNGAGAGRPPGG